MSVTKIGGWSAISLVVCFVVGIALMSGAGVQVLIPETGKNGLDWIADVDKASGAFFLGAWLVITGGIIGLVALVGFYQALRSAGEWLVLAPILAIASLTLVTISHLVPIAVGYELVPNFKPSEADTFDTFASLAQVLNYTGDIVLWGVVVPMYGIAVLKTGLIHRWIGWLAVAVGVFAGVGGLLSPLSSVIDGVTFIGFVGFFAWMAAMGVSLLRGRPPAAASSPAVPA